MPKIMLLGDTHGNTGFVCNSVIPAAMDHDVEWIYQVGDFGYWEHTPEGIHYLDDINTELEGTGIKIVFIAGNHDKVSLIPRNYHKVDGFYQVRSSIWFAPNGLQWEFEGTSFLALGGAYSIDKQYRLQAERENAQKMIARSHLRNAFSEEYIIRQAYDATSESLWFPEEEMTDSDLERIIYDLRDTRVDVILAHDKPTASNPMMRLLPINEALPNQRRLQKAVNILQPKLFVHGHLHARYTDTIRCGDNTAYTQVQGLGADVPNFNQLESSWEPTDAWEFLSL